jgi:LPS O-antigen subunit length determinant protein (WzzB/FepE family)
MPVPSFDLIDVIKTIQKKFRLIIIITLAAMAVGAVFFFVKRKKYKATAHFFVNNPLYGDRSSLFRNVDTRYVDYFGGDDDLDKVTALLGSDTVKDRIIRNCQFQVIYKDDINTERGHAHLMDIFDKNFSFKRTEMKEIQVSYIAYDSVTAANVANMATKVVEETFRAYYSLMKKNMADAIEAKGRQLDSSIALLTDSLANMRDRSGIYTIMSPNRENLMNGEVHSNGKGTGTAMEQIQNVEAIKDMMVSDRAKYFSIQNELMASASNQIEYIKVTTRAVPPTGPSGPSLMFIEITAALLGIFFSACFVLLMAYYRLLNAVVR